MVRWRDSAGSEADELAVEVGFTGRWTRRTGTRLSGAVGFSDVPGTGFCARRASRSFFLNLGTSRESRVLLSQMLLWAKDVEGKHSQGLRIVGSSSFAKCTFAFFGGKLFKCHSINRGFKEKKGVALQSRVQNSKPNDHVAWDRTRALEVR